MVQVWAMEGAKCGELEVVLKAHRRAITFLAFAARDDCLLASGDECGQVCLWHLAAAGHEDDSASEQQDDGSLIYTKANLPWYAIHVGPSNPECSVDNGR